MEVHLADNPVQEETEEFLPSKHQHERSTIAKYARENEHDVRAGQEVEPTAALEMFEIPGQRVNAGKTVK